MVFPFLAASIVGISFIKLGALHATNAFLGAGFNLALLIIVILAITLLRHGARAGAAYGTAWEYSARGASAGASLGPAYLIPEFAASPQRLPLCHAPQRIGRFG